MNKLRHIEKAEAYLEEAVRLQEQKDTRQSPLSLAETNADILAKLGIAQVHATLAVARPLL